MAYDNVNVNVNGNQDYASTLQTYGTVVLKPNIEDNRNVLTPCMMRKKNTKYVIKWDYELAEDITVPENCLIEFDGGSISNAEGSEYTLTGQDTILIYNQELEDVIKDVELEGTWVYKNGAGNADREPTDGMGKIYLKKDKTFTEQLTQENTIYVIQYDFTLTDDVELPSNCILEFDGGSISGAYTITGDNTGIKAGLVKIFGTDVTLAGTWSVAEAYPEWFEGVDLLKCVSCFDNILLTAANYTLASSITLDKETTIRGNGNTCINYTGSDDFVFLIHKKSILSDFNIKANAEYSGEIVVIERYTLDITPSWTRLSNMSIDGISNLCQGVTFKVQDNNGIAWCVVSNVSVKNANIAFCFDPKRAGAWINSNEIISCMSYGCNTGLRIKSANNNMIQQNFIEIKGQAANIDGAFVDIDEGTECVNNVINTTLWDAPHSFDGESCVYGSIRKNISYLNRRLCWDTANVGYAHLIGTLPKEYGSFVTLRISRYRNAAAIVNLAYYTGTIVCLSALISDDVSGPAMAAEGPLLYFYEYEGLYYIAATYNVAGYMSVEVLDTYGFTLCNTDQRYLKSDIWSSIDVDYKPLSTYPFLLNSENHFINISTQNTTLDIIKNYNNGGIRVERAFKNDLGIQGNNTLGYVISYTTKTSLSSTNKNVGSTALFIDTDGEVHIFRYNGDNAGTWNQPLRMQPVKYFSTANRNSYGTALSGSPYNKGFQCFDVNFNQPCYWNGTVWVNGDGVDLTGVTSVKGATATREAMTLSSVNEGLRYYDTTLKKYVLWNGTEWTNLDGSALGE